MSNVHTPESDPAHFLKIAGQGAALASHADLWRWLQGDVQQWLAHEIMLIGWGDFRSGNLHFDIVSSLPGVRTHNCTQASLAPLLGYLRDCWAAAQHAPLQIDITACRELLAGRSEVMAGMRSAVVHGIGDGHKRTGERIFVALSGQEAPPAGAATALKLLLPYIDMALRQMAPAPQRQAACMNNPLQRQVVRLSALSDRERQIMTWVAMGKTNPEIGCILSISEFTVKNHMKSIFGKLDVTNRAQAVAKLTRVDAYA
ncbi:MAG TPA: XrtB/PEP-CTERM-associated transcriptional regulator EpsA [Ramlibacter sp.]|nr:XrtB/PEP-CTERM-associated transcriptional regulator EpsA [Ramlibacter sp.]